MQKIVIIKYGELSTKKDNIGFFLSTLKNNVAKVLEGIPAEIKNDSGRMFVYAAEEYLNEIVEKLQKVFGIYAIIIGYKDNDFDINKISQNTIDLLKQQDFKTFKIETKRSNKNYELTSMEVSKKVGAAVLKNIKGLEVNVHNPEVLMEIEIRQKEVLFYSKKMKGLGGYPVGTLGHGLLMLSGGIDSPVAGFMAIKRGIRLEAVYFESPPHTSIQAKNKVQELAKKLAVYNASIKLHIINFTDIQESILRNIPNDYLITIMRRMMYRISERIAKRNHCQILINGESIGQVASQTLTSMKCINAVVNLPVIRPLCCFDKLEIIDLAKKIDTYETSILPYEDCCTIFVPKHPVINPTIEKCEEYEQNIDYEALINTALKTSETILINANDTNKYSDLL